MQTLNFEQYIRRQQEDTDFESLLKFIPKPSPESNYWIAGGALRRTLIKQKLDSDVDYFFRNDEGLLAFRTRLETLVEDGTIVIKEAIVNEHNTQYRLEYMDEAGPATVIIQAITIRFYPTVEDLLDSFDYTICQFAYDGEGFFCGDYALTDLYRMRLVPHKITYAVASLRRMLKYSNQGFYACSGALTTFLNEVHAHPETIATKIEYID